MMSKQGGNEMPLEHELPALDETRCTGCGDCVIVCPVDCLEMADSMPILRRPEDCVSCAICAEVCPAEALRLAGTSEC
jgi:2-oxoglutarate ferredoxin oxidoreductase subunit delta